VERLRQLGGQAKTAEIHDYLRRKWQLSAQALSLRDKAGGIHYRKHIDGAIAQLTKASLITRPERGLLQLPTNAGESIPTVAKGEAGEKAQQSYHSQICEMLYEIGQMEKKGSEKEYRINGERIDVAWKKIEAGAPYAVFEVQVSGNFYEALTKLKHAWDKWNSTPFLVTTDQYKDRALEWIKGSFHEIQQEMRVMDCEKVRELYEAVKTVKNIKTEFGIK
jgi:predicted RNA-binding protein